MLSCCLDALQDLNVTRQRRRGTHVITNLYLQWSVQWYQDSRCYLPRRTMVHIPKSSPRFERARGKKYSEWQRDMKTVFQPIRGAAGWLVTLISFAFWLEI